MSEWISAGPVTPRETFAFTLDRLLRSKKISNVDLERTLHVNRLTVGDWRRGACIPMPDNFLRVRDILIKEEINTDELERHYISARRRRPFAPSNTASLIVEKAVEQIPAAFRFGIRDHKIDALPENFETLDRDIAQELYNALSDKLAELLRRLNRSNSDPYAVAAVERLLASLGDNFDQMRPGVVLGHFRSIEAVVAGFDSEEGRTALFPDAIAMFTDVNLSGQDLLACFPEVRRIERARIAAGIEKDPAAIKEIREQTGVIKAAAAESGIVAPGALRALHENDPDIEQAKDVGLAADLTADEALVSRNFVSEVLRAAWDIVGPEFKAGTQVAARMLPPLAVITLVTLIAGPVGGLAAIMRGDLFKTVRGGMQTVQRASNRKSRKASQVPAGPDAWHSGGEVGWSSLDNPSRTNRRVERTQDAEALYSTRDASKKLNVNTRVVRVGVETGAFPKPNAVTRRGKIDEYWVDKKWIEDARKVLRDLGDMIEDFNTADKKTGSIRRQMENFLRGKIRE